MLLGDTGGDGTRSGGFADDIPHPTQVKFAWMMQRFPAAVPPGSYDVKITLDRYVKKSTALTNDVYRVGTRVYLLYDSLYDNDGWNADTDLPGDGFAFSMWPGRAGVANPPHVSGTWQQLDFEGTVTTATGNFEFRLLLHDKNGDPQAVAWDNIRVSITTPCNAPRFDFDEDGDVDHEDFAVMQNCVSAAGVPEGCRCAQGDSNPPIDSTDMAAFEACASGTDVPANPSCDAGLPFP
jgi:hypothetical protein